MSIVPPVAREQARTAFESGKLILFFLSVGSEGSVQLCWRNQFALLRCGLLESPFIIAVTATRVNNHHDYRLISDMLRTLDRKRLLETGDPLPHKGLFDAYRGVAAYGRARRVRGYSWTLDRDQADWFAKRGAGFGLEKPVVFHASVPIQHVGF